MINLKSLITDDWRVSGRIYRDEGIFEQEMEKIFARAWIFVAHETEIPTPGDYKTTFVGVQPIIVTRGADDGEIYAMFNRCRHRGAAVCQHDTGNANFFRCAYHGWTYTNTGKLVGVPFPDGYEDLDKDSLGLVSVPHVANYRGLIFVSLNPTPPPIEEYLGHACRYLDLIIERGDGIVLSAGCQKTVYEGNWKLQVENTIDAYHFGVVHASYLKLLERRTATKGTLLRDIQQNPDWRTLDLGNGHAVAEFGTLDDGGHGLSLGDDLPFNLIIFPNIGFVGAHIRVVLPRAANKTEVHAYPILLKDASPEVNAERLRQHEGFYGPAGFGAPDDVEVAFDRVAAGLRASGGNDWIILRRGLHREQVDERGVRVGRSSDEVPQRAFYRRWLQLMREAERGR